MVNGAQGSAWSSLRGSEDHAAALILGAPASDDPAALTDRHLFDLASLTKIATAMAALTLVEDGRIDLDEPVAPYLEVGSGLGASGITLRHLLTHTAGMPATSSAWRDGIARRPLVESVLALPLAAPPGVTHCYSCAGYIAVGVLIETLTGTPLDAAIRERVIDPAGAATLTYGPVPPEFAVATEIGPDGLLVRGGV
ncbi:serine hydrolase domain-containing protein, partial [Microbacterium lacticum]|uniref:serine hydrolase domain-containing protein n=1 Tax=Microbacterium lacticum TaxID=33885 RepID=UPI0028D09519